jgi:hypothetical protein
LAAAAVAAFWASMQFVVFVRLRDRLTNLQTQVSSASSAVSGMRASAAGRQKIAGIRSGLAQSSEERGSVSDLLATLAESAPPGTQLDSFTVQRVSDGWKTAIFGRAAGATGSAAVGAATTMYHHLQRRSPKLRNLDFQVSSYLPASRGDTASLKGVTQLAFEIVFTAPGPVQR